MHAQVKQSYGTFRGCHFTIHDTRVCPGRYVLRRRGVGPVCLGQGSILGLLAVSAFVLIGINQSDGKLPCSVRRARLNAGEFLIAISKARQPRFFSSRFSASTFFLFYSPFPRHSYRFFTSRRFTATNASGCFAGTRRTLLE